MLVVAGLPPSLIIGHDEDDVGLWAGLRRALSQEPRALEQEKKECERFHFLARVRILDSNAARIKDVS